MADGIPEDVGPGESGSAGAGVESSPSGDAGPSSRGHGRGSSGAAALDEGSPDDPDDPQPAVEPQVPIAGAASRPVRRVSVPPAGGVSPARSRSGDLPDSTRAFSFQLLLGYRGVGDPFDVNLEDELLTELDRAGIDITKFRAKLAKSFRADERDAALAQLQEDFHTSLQEFEHLCRSAGTRLAQRQRQALDVAGVIIRAATALSLLIEKLDGELKGMRGDHSRWVVDLEKALANVHGDQEKRLNVEFNHVQKVIAAVRAGSADVARLMAEIDKRGREMLDNHKALAAQYTGFTGGVQRKLLVWSAAAGLVGAAGGSLLAFLLFFWSGAGS